jgi:hypothetical protein
MRRVWIGSILFVLLAVLSGTVVSTRAAPLFALALPEGRTYDQAHNQGYIDWSGPVQYVYLTHRDNTTLPPEEGGGSCNFNCQEWVTRMGNGGSVSGAFDRNVSSFAVAIAFSHDAGVGSATVRACSASLTWNLYLGPGSGLPGFVNMPLSVPDGCRTWSLTASGGYVDFRSIDVYYSAPPNTPTPTLTRTPTPTFTPTATFTNTPSPTPTPLPPQIVSVVVCDLWGDAGWCRGEAWLELSASDPQGFDLTITGDLNGVPFKCGSSCTLPLPEGMGTAAYMVTSTSGRTDSGMSTWQRDDTPPELNPFLPPVDGRNGWYVSEVELSASATDTVSGLSILNGSLDGGTTWISFPVHFTNGDHQVLIHARDVAGNETAVSRSIRVDTVPPTAQITSHSNGEVVQGSVLLGGTLEDEMAGPAGGEISTDDGMTWQTVSMGAGNTWSHVWASNEAPNGEYTIQMRGMDQAGNVGEVVSITLLVDNGPPSVSITERWWIWETGELRVSPNHFPLASVEVAIGDPQDRWPALVMELKPGKTSYPVKWDRRFGDGTLAPSGEYMTIAVACDVNGLCGQDAGMIVIPSVAASTATLTPSPTATNTLVPTATPTLAPMLPTPVTVVETPLPEKPRELPHSAFPLWQVIGLLGLFFVIASASVVDPRPQALDRLGETFRIMSAPARDENMKTNNDEEKENQTWK